MENCPERCLTSKSVYEKQRNLSYAKIYSDSHAERTAGRVATAPLPERRWGASGLALDARPSRHSWSTVATRLCKNSSAVHVSFHQGYDEGSGHSHLHRASAADP